MLRSDEWSLVVCGGGSGGHLFPALAVVEELRQRQAAPERVIFLTPERPIDRQVLEAHGIEQHALNAINSHQLRRQPVRSLQALSLSIWQARRLLRTVPAPVVLGTGGFGSLPGILAARWQKRPILLLEQNVIPGRTTSFLARFARHVCLSFLETRQFLPKALPTENTGNPVRNAIAWMTLHSSDSKKCLLVLGGSQGAAALNDGLIRFAEHHGRQLADWTILHQTGESDRDRVQQAYRRIRQKAEVAAYFENVSELYSRASLVVTRAGGTSLAEIACAGLPAIIIPYPKSLRNHQLINAQHFAGREAACLVEQGPAPQFDLNLTAVLRPLLEEKQRRQDLAAAMRACARPDAAQQVCDLLLKTVTQP